MRSLGLIAASGLAREVIALERSRDRYDDLYLFDDDPALHGTSIDGVGVRGPVAAVAAFDGELLICAGSGQVRRRIAGHLGDLGLPSDAFARVIHPGVEIPDGCVVGAGSILLSSVVLTTAVHVHRHVVVMPNVTLTHDDVINDYATLCAGVSLGGRVTVEPGAYLGMNASVRQDVTLGRDSVLGMGAVLVRDLPAGQTWSGVPASPHATRKQLVP